jgi:hypothetical protein
MWYHRHSLVDWQVKSCVVLPCRHTTAHQWFKNISAACRQEQQLSRRCQTTVEQLSNNCPLSMLGKVILPARSAAGSCNGLESCWPLLEAKQYIHTTPSSRPRPESSSGRHNNTRAATHVRMWQVAHAIFASCLLVHGQVASLFTLPCSHMSQMPCQWHPLRAP